MKAARQNFHDVARCEIVHTISLGRDESLHPVAAKERRDLRADIRMTKSEQRQWKAEAKALGLTLSAYLRAKMNGKPVEVIKLADPELLAELRRHGNNFNQCNHGAHAGWPIDPKRYNKAFDLLIEAYRRLLDGHA